MPGQRGVSEVRPLMRDAGPVIRKALFAGIAGQGLHLCTARPRAVDTCRCRGNSEGRELHPDTDWAEGADPIPIGKTGDPVSRDEADFYG